jgi:hypothetical protein
MDYNSIYQEISSQETNVVYVGVGSWMGQYQEITPQNNQQYPCFLNKFADNKVIILFDAELEVPLKSETYFEETLGIIWTFKNTIYENNVPILRIFKNESTTIFAINKHIYYETSIHQTNEINQQVAHDLELIKNIISLCLNKEIPTKLIWQDYTGRDTTIFYQNYCKIFNKQLMFDNVCFDITQKNNGCYIELIPDLPRVDNFGRFIPEKYLTLSQLKRYESQLFRDVLVERINILNHPIVWTLSKKELPPMYEYYGLKSVTFLNFVYQVETLDFMTNFNELFYYVVKDISDALNCDPFLYDQLIEQLDNPKVVQNTLSLLKCLD